MKLSVLIPYRPDTAHRMEVHRFTSELWKKSGVEVIYSDDALDGPVFSFARAINRARKRAKGDWFLSYSVDAIPPSKGLIAMIERMLEAGTPWAVGWKGQARFTQQQTEMILQNVGPKHVGLPQEASYGREAIVAVRADVWDTLGGYDPRFVGWGPEDKAFHLALKTFFPSGWDQPTGEMFQTLWHPPVARTQLTRNKQLFAEYQKLATEPEKFKAWYLATTRQKSVS